MAGAGRVRARGELGVPGEPRGICVLNTSGEEARLQISFYFEERGPIKDVEMVVPPERTRHIRTESLDGVEIPRGVPYAMRVESSVPSWSSARGWIPRRLPSRS